MAKRSGEDLYDYLKKKWRRTEIKEAAAIPTPIRSQEPTTRCNLSISLPQRNPNFTGREEILANLRGSLTSGQIAAWKQALTGLGGTGKSQIAAEYAYRHQGDYQFIWWLGSEELPRWLPIILVWLPS